MALKSLVSIAAILLSWILICHMMNNVTSNVQKTGTINKYCGDDFLNAWFECCGNNPTCENSKREIQDDLVLSPNTASKFLWISSGRRRSLISKRSGSTDAVEECCHEGCSLSEIAEYDCI